MDVSRAALRFLVTERRVTQLSCEYTRKANPLRQLSTMLKQAMTVPNSQIP